MKLIIDVLLTVGAMALFAVLAYSFISWLVD